MIHRIKELINSGIFSRIALFIIGWVILFDLIGGIFIPMAYGKGCGWFAIPNLFVDLYVIDRFIQRIRHEDTH